MEIKIPLRIVSVANLREHWAATAKRAKAHRHAALMCPRHSLPCVIGLVRVAPRPLDDDNLRSAFKALRDGIADRLGVADNDPRVKWEYDQERGRVKEYGVIIRLYGASSTTITAHH